MKIEERGRAPVLFKKKSDKKAHELNKEKKKVMHLYR